jgi:ABC-type sugar transport system ATPase subunit
METQAGTALELRGVTKYYPGVTALDDVSFVLKQGEIHVLVGENGAGKSTLVKIIVGDKKPEKVEGFFINEEPVTLATPADALRYGIAAVHQHFALAPDMSVTENIFMGREERANALVLDDGNMNAAAERLLSELGVELNPRLDVRGLSPGDRQVVEICKALSQKPRILLLDEPTSGLNDEEIQRLFGILNRLKSQGVSIIYISHRLEEVFEIGDSVTVFRNGKNVFAGSLKEITHDKLAQLIVGKEIKNRYPKREISKGDVVFEAVDLENSESEIPLKGVSVSLRAGEILGVYGILGSGKDELARTIAGVQPATGGGMRLRGREIFSRTPKSAIAAGIGYLTDDRHENGLVLGMTVKQNQTLVALKKFTRLNHILAREEAEVSDRFIDALNIRTPGREFVVNNLSGGNQQKVVLSKWLITEPDLLILHEPTRGIDIGSKVEVFRLMVDEAEKGRAILLVSSELDEVAEMADRILVMSHGRIIGEYGRHEVSHDELLRLATQKRTKEEARPNQVG